jgi:Nuclease-related domain
VGRTARDAPPYVESWHEGAEGERKTEQELKPLERAGWRIVHDVQNAHGNYDHIAVSRAGVFLLETKNLRGVVELRGGVPHLRRRLDPEADTSCERFRRGGEGRLSYGLTGPDPGLMPASGWGGLQRHRMSLGGDCRARR